MDEAADGALRAGRTFVTRGAIVADSRRRHEPRGAVGAAWSLVAEELRLSVVWARALHQWRAMKCLLSSVAHAASHATKQSLRIRKTPAWDPLFWLPLFALDPVTLLARHEAVASPELADPAGVTAEHEARARPGGTS